MNRAFALDVADYLRDRVLWRDRDQHVDVVLEHVSFLDSAFFLLCQLLEHVA